MNPVPHRNLALDWVKGWMILFVILIHTWVFPEYQFHLAVDVFFFISGYLMMLSYGKRPTTAVLYTWRRIKIIGPPFVVALFVRCCLGLGSFFSVDGYDELVKRIIEVLYTFCFAEELGMDISSAQLLTGSWYFSVLVIGSFLLYSMLEYNGKMTSRILFPLIALLGLNSLIAYSGNFSSWTRIAMLGVPLIRGCSEMAAGAVICSVYQENKPSFERHHIFINMMGIIAGVLFMLLMFTHENMDRYSVVTIPWMLLAAVIDGSWLTRGLSRIHGGVMAWVGKYTLYVLCAHWPAYMVVNWCNDSLLGHSLNGVMLALVCVLAVIPATALLFIVCRGLKKIFS